MALRLLSSAISKWCAISSFTLCVLPAIAACGSDPSSNNHAQAGTGGSVAGQGGASESTAGQAGAPQAEIGGAGGSGGLAGNAGSGGAMIGSKDVRGQVVNQWRAPYANVELVVAGTKLVTDAAGQFSLADAPETYDIVHASADKKQAYVWHGLARRDPVITLNAETTHTVRAKVKTLGSTADETTIVSYECLGVSASERRGEAVEFEVSFAAPSVECTFVAVAALRESPEGKFIDFTKAAAKTVQITQAAPEIDVELTVLPIQSRTVTLKVIGRDAESLVYVSSGPIAPLKLFEQSNADESETTFTLKLLPNSMGYKNRVGANAVGFAASFEALADDATSVETELRLPEYLSPLNQQIVENNAKLEFRKEDGLPFYEVQLLSHLLRVHIYTAEALALPELAAVGIEWPKGISFRYLLTVDNRASNIDDFVVLNAPKPTTSKYRSDWSFSLK